MENPEAAHEKRTKLAFYRAWSIEATGPERTAVKEKQQACPTRSLWMAMNAICKIVNLKKNTQPDLVRCLQS